MNHWEWKHIYSSRKCRVWFGKQYSEYGCCSCFKRNCLMLCILFSGGLLHSIIPWGPFSLLEHRLKAILFLCCTGFHGWVALSVFSLSLKDGHFGCFYFFTNTGSTQHKVVSYWLPFFSLGSRSTPKLVCASICLLGSRRTVISFHASSSHSFSLIFLGSWTWP